MKRPPAPRDVAGLPNLGPASAGMLAEAGITSVGQLRRLGAARAFRRVLFARGGQASTNLLWALEGALSGTRWDRLPPETRRRLLDEVARGA
jgi:DNA transformation protein